MEDNRPLQLLQLPDEVLISVCDFLDFSTLRRAILVCKHLNGLAEPFLYHTIRILRGRQATILSGSLRADHRRLLWIRSLLVSTRFGDDSGLSHLPPYIANMRNLQDLRLETPDCNAKLPEDRLCWIVLQNRYERIFETSSALVMNQDLRYLPNLKKCTLHFVDAYKEIYSMTKYAMLFLHPTLESLTMSCASTDYPHKLLVPFQDDPTLVKSTALQHLHLEECDIWSPTLSILLSFPRALKSLKISEGVRYDGLFSMRSSRLHGNVSPGTFVEAIATHCRESLEELSLSLGYFRHGSQDIDFYGQHLDLTRFNNIKSLELELRTVNLVRVRAPCDHATSRRLPPNLERLKVFGIPLGQRMPFRALRKAYFPFDTCLVKDKIKHGTRNLKHVIYSYEYYREDAESPNVSDDGDMIEEASQVTQAQTGLMDACRNDLLPIYRKANVNLEIEMVVLPTGFIPPYLYPEDTPRPYTFWQSDFV